MPDAWPPALTDEERSALLVEANTFALAHGLAYLPVDFTSAAPPVAAIHAPFTLLPTPFPRALFDLASTLQPIYNALYSRIACDTALLDSVLGTETGIGRIDPFTGKLWSGWKELRDRRGIRQPLQLGIFRSDYLLHAPAGSDATPVLKQVEFNTISSSFGSLSTVVSRMHRHLFHRWGARYLPHLRNLAIPENPALDQFSAALACAHSAYGVQGSVIMFVVQPGERNVFDQRMLEYRLEEVYGISSIRLTLQQIGSQSVVDPDGRLTIPTSSVSTEVAVVYFRAGYTPTDYHSDADYNTRFLLEGSRAIKCPSIPLQLAGTKKIQEHITHAAVLDQLLQGLAVVSSESSPEDMRRTLQASWMGMWGLDVEGGVEKAISQQSTTVLKPQREGGGNNIYRSQIPDFVRSMPPEERSAWIAMELIQVPKAQSLMVKAGSSDAQTSNTVSELGVYGWSLFTTSGEVIHQDAGGWLLRTKGEESDEGGIAVGISVLDSPVLI